MAEDYIEARDETVDSYNNPAKKNIRTKLENGSLAALSLVWFSLYIYIYIYIYLLL